MGPPRLVLVGATQAGERLDRFLADTFPDLSRTTIQKLIACGWVTLNGAPVKASAKVQGGDKVVVEVPPAQPVTLEPQPMPLSVVYEDQEALVVDKPAGMVVHPAAGHAQGTLVNALLAHCPQLEVGGSIRPGIVHRLDKNTSGLMVVAKTDRAQASLSQQLKERSVVKEYITLVWGTPRSARGLIEAPIGRHPRSPKLMAVVEGGRPAITNFQVVRHLGDFSLLMVRPETGRTHQIRVHLAAIGHPVVGDSVYGQRRAPGLPSLSRQFLHASRLAFLHPLTGRRAEFTSPLPPDLQSVLDALASRASGPR